MKTAQKEPTFLSEFERYDWLLKHGAKTLKDKRFMRLYKKESEHRLLFR